MASWPVTWGAYKHWRAAFDPGAHDGFLQLWPSVVATEQTRNATTYAVLTTPDIITFTAPTNGAALTRLFYAVQVKETSATAYNYSIDIFINGVVSGSVTNFATMLQTGSATAYTDYWFLWTPAAGLLTKADLVVLPSGVNTIDIRYKCGNAAQTLSAKNRYLCAEIVATDRMW